MSFLCCCNNSVSDISKNLLPDFNLTSELYKCNLSYAEFEGIKQHVQECVYCANDEEVFIHIKCMIRKGADLNNTAKWLFIKSYLSLGDEDSISNRRIR